MDSGLGMQYMITSMPTLLTFDRGEVMQDSRTMDVGRLRDKEWLREWIERRRDEEEVGAVVVGLEAGCLEGYLGIEGDRMYIQKTEICQL